MPQIEKLIQKINDMESKYENLLTDNMSRISKLEENLKVKEQRLSSYQSQLKSFEQKVSYIIQQKSSRQLKVQNCNQEAHKKDEKIQQSEQLSIMQKIQKLQQKVDSLGKQCETNVSSISELTIDVTQMAKTMNPISQLLIQENEHNPLKLSIKVNQLKREIQNTNNTIINQKLEKCCNDCCLTRCDSNQQKNYCYLIVSWIFILSRVGIFILALIDTILKLIDSNSSGLGGIHELIASLLGLLIIIQYGFDKNKSFCKCCCSSQEHG